MNQRWKVFRAIAIGAALAWLVTFVVTWHIRTGWQQHWADGALRAWSDFAMLGWIDTTFATGVLAVVAASTIFINGYIDRRARWREAQVVKLAQILNIIGQIELLLRRLAHEISTRQRADRYEFLKAEIEGHCQALTSDVTPITHLVMFACARVNEIAFQAGDRIDSRPGPQRHMMSIIWGAIYALDDPDRFFEPGTGRFVPQTRPVADGERENFRPGEMSSYDRQRFAVWLAWE